MPRVLAILILSALISHLPGTARATTEGYCFTVVNVPDWDVLNMRSGPSASNPIVDKLPPGKHGIISQSGPCIPYNKPVGSRWCPVAHYSGNGTKSGWVKRHFVAPSECP